MSEEIEFIKSVINKHLDPEQNPAFIFGSRAQQTSQRFSDYDIGIKGEKLDPETYFNLISEFEESDLPYTVDVVEFRDVSDAFKKIALKNIIPLNY